MKITVIKADVKVIIDESDNVLIKDNKTSLRWSDQMKNVHDTLEIIFKQINQTK